MGYSVISETWGQDAARHSVHEHHQLDDLMEELNTTDLSSPTWLTCFKIQRHDSEHHMNRNQSDVFTGANKLIGEEDNTDCTMRSKRASKKNAHQ